MTTAETTTPGGTGSYGNMDTLCTIIERFSTGDGTNMNLQQPELKNTSEQFYQLQPNKKPNKTCLC